MSDNRLDRVDLNVAAARNSDNPIRREPRAGGTEFTNLDLGTLVISIGTNDTGSGWHLVRFNIGNTTHIGWLSDNRIDRIDLNAIADRNTDNPIRREPRAGGTEFANPSRNTQMISIGTNDTGSGWHLIQFIAGNTTHIGWLSDNRLSRVDLNVVADRNANNPIRREPRVGGAEFANPSRNTQMISIGTNDTGSGWHLVRLVEGSRTHIGWLSDTRLSIATNNPGSPQQPQQPPINNARFVRPMARGHVSSEFGHRWGRLHSGIDLVGRDRESILAAAAGTVQINEWHNSLGWYIVIRHNINGRTYDTVYAHLRYQSSLRVGNTVSQGQQIGIQGNTGNSYGDHLHFEIHPGGRNQFSWQANAVCPRHYINFPPFGVWW